MEKVYITELFKKIANNQKVLLNQGTTKHGITYVQSLIVLYLDIMLEQHGEDYEVSQKDVERFLSLRSSTVTEILHRMEAGGYIRKEKSLKDNRSNRLCLTERAESFVPVFFDVLDEVETQITEGMSREDREKLKELLRKVSDNLEQMKL